MTSEIKVAEQKKVSYRPLGANEDITLSIGMVRRYLTVATKSGKLPNDDDVVKYMMLCKSRGLDPWVGDAYLIGYDSQDGPSFSLITAVQSLFKRAETHSDFAGLESGIIVQLEDGTVQEREGSFRLDEEKLVGGWARCWRSNLDKPIYAALRLSTFNTRRSRWIKDPEGMIAKCSESAVLRKAFPTQLSGLLTKEEMPEREATKPEPPNAATPAPGDITLDAILDAPVDTVDPHKRAPGTPDSPLPSDPVSVPSPQPQEGSSVSEPPREPGEVPKSLAAEFESELASSQEPEVPVSEPIAETSVDNPPVDEAVAGNGSGAPAAFLAELAKKRAVSTCDKLCQEWLAKASAPDDAEAIQRATQARIASLRENRGGW